ncbi:MAG: hypothetical protein F6K17_14955 [Okeania sp. SIO3C4]|nr:hypothetical protein [Okeania sp. SIO3C4]
MGLNYSLITPLFPDGHFSYQLSVISYQYLCNKETWHQEYALFLIPLKGEALNHNVSVK